MSLRQMASIFATIPFALALSAPVDAQQPAAGRAPAAEALARQIIQQFYSELDDRTVRQNLEPCTASSLLECFGGDTECVPPYIWGVSRASICTDDKTQQMRGALLARLDTLASAAPGSEWIAGQRAYLALKAGDSARATRASLDCSAGIWCQAVRGFVLHTLRPGSAGAVFDSVLAGATERTPAWGDQTLRPEPRQGAEARGYPTPPFIRDRGLVCEWRDLTAVIAKELSPGLWAEKDADGSSGTSNGRTVEVPAEAQAFLSEYQGGGCPNASVEARFWWLADPWWSDGYNERRDEHIARNVWRRLRGEVLTVGGPLNELNTVYIAEPAWQPASFVALGPPNSWGSGFRCGSSGTGQRTTCAAGTASPSFSNPEGRAGGDAGRTGSLTGPPRPYVNGGYSFAPDPKRFFDPVHSTARDWAVELNVGGERMITKETWYNVDEQTAVLRRGARSDSLLTLVAGRLPLVVRSFQGITANLALGRPADLDVQSTPARIDANGSVRASATVGEAEWLTSLELGGDGWRARSRHGAAAPTLASAFGLSDPVLVDERFEQSRDILGAMLPGTSVSARTVGIYFEVYGIEEGESLRFTLSAEAIKVDRSVLGRLGSLFRLGSSGGLPQRVVWSQPAALSESSPRMSHYLALDLGDVADGEYRLVLRVERDGGTSAVSSRIVQVSR